MEQKRKQAEAIIEKRNELRSRSGKITPEERLWLLTNPDYSEDLGYPHLRMDIIDLEAGKEYLFRVRLNKKETTQKTELVFNVPLGLKSGYIFFDGPATDIVGKTVKTKKAPGFGISLKDIGEEVTFLCLSKTGKIAVSYMCEVIMKAIFMPDKFVSRKLYSTIHRRLSMLIIEQTENKRVYSCTTDSGDCVFSVEWEKRI